MQWTVEPASRLDGEVRVPGDKSLSHRAVLFAAMADGDSTVHGLADGEDVASSAAAMVALGVHVEAGAQETVIRGRGLGAWTPPDGDIDCGNSGTTIRLLAGPLAGQVFESTLTGDASLRRRPMERIAAPLRAMGAQVTTSKEGTAPFTIAGGKLRGMRYESPVASAQVKSCVLLAGLFAEGATEVVEPALSRDHTERLLAAMGATVRVGEVEEGFAAGIDPCDELSPLSGTIPGDASSAAYWLVAATLLEGSRLVLPGVGMNPTRAALVDVLSDWGASIAIEDPSDWYGEPVATLVVEGVGRSLSGGVVEGATIPALIDELPLLALLAPFTRDGVEIRDAGELRVKESDRIASTAAALRALGAGVDEFPTGLAVAGGQGLTGGVVDAMGDHRIALAAGAVGVAATASVAVANAEAMRVSYPSFAEEIDRVARR